MIVEAKKAKIQVQEGQRKNFDKRMKKKIEDTSWLFVCVIYLVKPRISTANLSEKLTDKID